MSKKTYVAVLPNCDYCANSGVTRRAKYDAKSRDGRWANMCAIHFANNGIKLGTGYGQELIEGQEPETTDEEIRQGVMAAVDAGDWDALEDALGDRDFAEFM